MVFDWRWKRFQDRVIFTNLCKILWRKAKVKRSWRDDLRRTALLVGESANANDLLWCGWRWGTRGMRPGRPRYSFVSYL
jgi:hypothetical protein